MTFEITKTGTRASLNKLLQKYRKQRKGVSLKKYSGTVHFPVDGLEYQKKVRDEWR